MRVISHLTIIDFYRKIYIVSDPEIHMVNYPYTVKTGSLKKFLERIPLVGLPDNVSQKYLYTLDFKSTNDRAIIPILKFIKFLDGSGVPTDYYKEYRDTSKAPFILGRAIKEVYSDVFKLFPDAQKQDNNVLRNYFSTRTGLGEKAIKSTVDTFKALCSLAKFENKIQDDILEERDEFSGNDQSKMSLHTINYSLPNERKAKIIVPSDISKEEIDKLKKMLDSLK